MLTFDKNLIRSAGIQNAMDYAKVFLQRSLAILEENGQRHEEALSKVASLDAEVAKCRATTRTVWKVQHPKVANATIAFTEAVKSNHKLSSEVGSVLAKLLCTRLDGGDRF